MVELERVETEKRTSKDRFRDERLRAKEMSRGEVILHVWNPASADLRGKEPARQRARFGFDRALSNCCYHVAIVALFCTY